MIKHIIFIALILFSSVGLCKKETRKKVFIKFLEVSEDLKLKNKEIRAIGKTLNRVVGNHIDKSKYMLLAKDTIEMMIEGGIEECEGECDIEVGRMLSADIVISSELSEAYDEYTILLTLKETEKGEILNKISIEADSLKMLYYKVKDLKIKNIFPKSLNKSREKKSYSLNTGLLTISTSPPSEVFVDGESIGNTPVVDAKLEAGSYMIEMFTLKERKRYVDKISIVSGKETFKKIFLKRETSNKEANNKEKIRRVKKKYKENVYSTKDNSSSILDALRRNKNYRDNSINRVDFHIKLDLNSKVYIDNNFPIWVKDKVLSLTPGEHLFKFYNTTGVLTKRINVSRNNNNLVLNFKRDKVTDYKRKDRNNVSNESMSNLQLSIKKAVLKKSNLYKSCYERYFNRIGFEDIDGITFTVAFKIKIDNYGNASDIFLDKFSGVAKDKYSYAFKPFKRCMIRHLRRLRFGIEARNINFVYPFNFKMLNGEGM
tara:strand:+ start:414 stop:1874 length:1461 start_codon:yes stop_codon:yes gene_type:complete